MLAWRRDDAGKAQQNSATISIIIALIIPHCSGGLLLLAGALTLLNGLLLAHTHAHNNGAKRKRTQRNKRKTYPKNETKRNR